MAICGDPTGTAIIGGDGVFISGSGTPGDPWVINLVEPVDIADLQGDLASIQASLATLPTTYVNAAGDTMTGLLQVQSSSAGLRLRRTASERPYNEYYSSDALTRYAAIIGADTGLEVISDEENIKFYVNTVEDMRLDATRLLIGKPTTDIDTVGVEINHDVGAMWATLSTVGSWNVRLNRFGSANADGQIYLSVEQAGTQIGRIHRVSSTTSSFTGTSDRDLKENIAPVDDELALLWMRLVEPVFFNFKADPDIQQVGYIAQDTAEIWPNSIGNGVVDPGHGNVDDRTWDDDGNETTPHDVWSPWMMDYGRNAPLVHSALQAVDRVVQAQEARIADLEARLAAVEAVVKPK